MGRGDLRPPRESLGAGAIPGAGGRLRDDGFDLINAGEGEAMAGRIGLRKINVEFLPSEYHGAV